MKAEEKSMNRILALICPYRLQVLKHVVESEGNCVVHRAVSSVGKLHRVQFALGSFLEAG